MYNHFKLTNLVITDDNYGIKGPEPPSICIGAYLYAIRRIKNF